MTVLTALALWGCGSEQRIENGPTADINAAAEAAQGDIDTYAADTLEPVPPQRQARTLIPAPAQKPEDTSDARDADPAPSPEPTATSDVAAAADVADEPVANAATTQVQ